MGPRRDLLTMSNTLIICAMLPTVSTGTQTCFLTAVGRRWSLELRKPGPYAQDLNGLSVSSRSSRGALSCARRPTSMGKKLQTMLDHRSAVHTSTTGIPNDDGEKSKHAVKFDAMLATVKGLGMVNLRLFPAHLSLPHCLHRSLCGRARICPAHCMHSLKMRLRLSSCLLHFLPCCRIIFALIARLLSPPSLPCPPSVCARG
jgi:hypothetical protein